VAGQLARAIARFVTLCPHVRAVHDLVTKQRVDLAGGYVFDLYFNAPLGKYSYTLVYGDRRLIGWDNAPHHPDLTGFPHHVHLEDGSVVPSPLTGVPEQDIEHVAVALNEFLVLRF
jgi:hypothetical protein